MLIKIKKEEEEEENGCVQAVHSFITLKRPLIFLDTPTAPGCFAVSVYSHVSHKRINIIRLPLLMIRVNRLFTAQRSVKC